MALNLDMVGKKMDPVPFTYDADRVILYALGIGAGVEELVVPFIPSLPHDRDDPYNHSVGFRL